jgi:RNA polymerase sigma-70 factor (ECF subfamily)
MSASGGTDRKESLDNLRERRVLHPLGDADAPPNPTGVEIGASVRSAGDQGGNAAPEGAAAGKEDLASSLRETALGRVPKDVESGDFKSQDRIPFAVVSNSGQEDWQRFTEAHASVFRPMVNSLSRCAARDSAIEAVQDAFGRCWEHRAELRNKAALPQWIRRTALNGWRSAVRRSSCCVPLNESAEVLHPDAAITPAAIDLRRALRSISVRDRWLLVNHYVAGHTCEDLARASGVDATVVYGRLARARRRLRATLGPSYDTSMSTGSTTGVGGTWLTELSDSGPGHEND